MHKTMKFRLFLLISLITIFSLSSLMADDNITKKSTFSGPYMGQEPPGTTPQIFAPGFISTDLMELNSVFTPDGKEFYYAIYTPGASCKIYYTKSTDKGWTKPEPVSFSAEDSYSDVDMCITFDDQKMFFGSTRPVKGVKQKDYKIWYAERTDNGWSEAKYLDSPLNDGKRALYPSVSQSGTMYFQAIREDSFGAMDIYFSKLKDGKYTAPIHMGKEINSEHPEGDVAIAPDESYLIVSSSGRADSLGSGDLYISFKKKDGSWTELKNMGASINSPSLEYCPMITHDGKYIFFTSKRTGGGDIYWVDTKIIDKYKSEDFPLLKGDYLGQKPPGKKAELFAPGIISSDKKDGCVIFFDDGNAALFARIVRNEETKKWKRNIFLMKRVNGIWQKPELTKFSELRYFGDFTNGNDGKTILVSASKPEHMQAGENMEGGIGIVRYNNGKLSDIEFFDPPLNTVVWDGYPSITKSGKLYFMSQGRDGFGNMDFFTSELKDGKYTEPKNLGEPVNTVHREIDPFIAPDESYLIYAVSKKEDGKYKTSDMFISFKKEDGTWSEPINMGTEVNSPDYENRPYVTPDGKYFFWQSARDRKSGGIDPNSVTKGDIYWISAEIINDLKAEWKKNNKKQAK